MALFATRYSLLASLKSVLVAHAVMVAVIEPEVLGEPDRLRADRDHQRLDVEVMAAGRDQDRGAEPQQDQAEKVHRKDEQEPAFAHRYAPADIEPGHRIFRAGIREPDRAKHAHDQHADHDTTLCYVTRSAD